MKKILFILFFCLTMLFNFSNANTIDEALGEINIFNSGHKSNFLSVNGNIQNLTYVYFEYMDSTGKLMQIPTYCVNPAQDGVAQAVESGESVSYIANELASDPKVTGIITSGYPHYTLESLGLSDKYQGYYATKVALWCYLIPSWNIENVKVNPNLKGNDLIEAQKVLEATKNIYTRGMWWNKMYKESLTSSVDKEYAYNVTINGEEYKQQIITVRSETWVTNGIIRVQFAIPEDVPEGTLITDMNNNPIEYATIENTGDGYAGKFKILYPLESIDGENGSIQLNFTADVTKYATYYAVCAEKDIYGNLQNYIADTDPTTTLRLSGISKYNENNIQNALPDTGIEITKVEEGTNIGIANTIFEVIDPDGASIGTFSTDENGKIIIPLNVSGNYTITEIAPAQYYLPAENPTQHVKVTYNNLSKVTFENAPYGAEISFTE